MYIDVRLKYAQGLPDSVDSSLKIGSDDNLPRISIRDRDILYVRMEDDDMIVNLTSALETVREYCGDGALDGLTIDSTSTQNQEWGSPATDADKGMFRLALQAVYTGRLLKFSEAEKVGKGRASIVGGILQFDPLLTSYDLDSDKLAVLLDYVTGYQPGQEVGSVVGSGRSIQRPLIRFPLEYSVKQSDHLLSLSMQEDRDWGSGEIIDVVDSDTDGLAFVLATIREKKVSSFVFGKLVDVQESDGHTVIRRYFME